MYDSAKENIATGRNAMEVISEKDIVVGMHTYSKKIHFVAEAQEHWLKGIKTYAFSDEYDEEASAAGVHVVKFKDEWPKGNQNFLSDGRATMAFGYLRALLAQDESILWVFFGDDDTYFVFSEIFPRLPAYDPKEKWVLCPDVTVPHNGGDMWCYGGRGMIVSRGAMMAVSPLDTWDGLGKFAYWGGDTRFSHMLTRLGNATLTDISSWGQVGKHRIIGEKAKMLCKHEGRCTT